MKVNIKLISQIPIYDKGIIIEYAIVDPSDYDMLSTYIFRIYTNSSKTKKYAISNKNLSMHEMVMGRKAGFKNKIDHINSNGLDNRRCNLRIITDSENAHNRIKKKNTTSQYIGVSKGKNKWVSQIVKNYKTFHIGVYDDEKEAARAYDVWAIHLYGTIANTNNLVNDIEKEWILNNNSPLKQYMKHVKIRVLPKNIYHCGDKYAYTISRDGVKYQKNTFVTVEDAKKSLEELVHELSCIKKQKEKERCKNILRNSDGVAIIPIFGKNGYKYFDITVDDHVWIDVSRFSWSIADKCYSQARVNGKRSRMHVYIYEKYIGHCEVPKGYTVDHINPISPHDNRIKNLRINTYRGQMHNQNKRSTCVTRYRGVVMISGKFRVQIDSVNYGLYETEEEAALKYNEVIKEKYGNTARLNIITTSGTKVEDYFKNATIEFVKNITKCTTLKSLIRVKADWKELYDIKLTHINKKTFEHYKSMIVNHMMKINCI